MTHSINTAITLAQQGKIEAALDDLFEQVDTWCYAGKWGDIDQLLLISPTKMGLELAIGLLSIAFSAKENLSNYMFFLKMTKEFALITNDPERVNKLLIGFDK